LVDLTFDDTGCVLHAAFRVTELGSGPAAWAEDNRLHDDFSPGHPDGVLTRRTLDVKIRVEELVRKRFGHHPIIVAALGPYGSQGAASRGIVRSSTSRLVLAGASG
jgi:hypothetical protein